MEDKDIIKIGEVKLDQPLAQLYSRDYLIEFYIRKFSESIIDGHAYRVSRLCERMGKQLNLMEKEIEELSITGLFHDIGKITVDKGIINKPGRLTIREHMEMARHSEMGHRILSSVSGMEIMAEYVLYHHERWDGHGYPQGLKGKAIPFQSRIICLADSYDAMTSDRSYRKAMSKKAAIQEVLRNSGTQFDPELANVFIKMV